MAALTALRDFFYVRLKNRNAQTTHLIKELAEDRQADGDRAFEFYLPRVRLECDTRSVCRVWGLPTSN